MISRMHFQCASASNMITWATPSYLAFRLAPIPADYFFFFLPEENRSVNISSIFIPVRMGPPSSLAFQLALIHADYFFFFLPEENRSVNISSIFIPVRMGPPFYLVCRLAPIHANAPLDCLA